MRKLDLKNYTFSVPDQKGILQFITYDFHKSLSGILSHPSLGLNGPELLKSMEVIEKVEKSKEAVLLTEDDYQLIIDTTKRFRGFSKNDAQFLKRIYNCPVVPDEKDMKFSNNGKEKK